MSDISNMDILGHWIGIFLTFCILSFLYKDNPFYKFAEHLFIGVSIGYVVMRQYYDVLEPKLIVPIAESERWYFNWRLVALILVAMMFVKAVSKRHAWVGRFPLAFIVALYAGIEIVGVAQGDLGAQIKRGMVTLDYQKVNVNRADEAALASLPGISPAVANQIVKQREQQEFVNLEQVYRLPGLTETDRDRLAQARGSVQGLDARASVHSGDRYWFGIINRLLLLLGLITALIYFYFSVEHKGTIGVVSRVGVWILMIGFGASFGLTVQGRLALAVGRVQAIRGDTLEPAIADQIHGPIVALVSVIVIVFGIVAWEFARKR